MQIILNGKEYQLNGPVSIEDLLKDLGHDGSRLVVELNSTIINKELYSATVLKEGDSLEMVRLVGGG
ncbi:MAG: thiamine biosynthesis protein ThiS [Candidatus Edwardsbacteria bacterium RIFOXYD12_FULL_50_11]|uniref:Thiamine biosynthesis protein ThiS n=1 Tax=Candidatus Edwardsbacteria bacterium GWF2_54_11 TaxID=1817851 RepID=A0A1F5RIG7_9BACT|nr:MAG: thiamine biosynthesis protein ThiS [Candidatus Edwardsbacteria bacterium RifOxyC12_full_54_24]OGF07248.1 MAG: thiamine biosynthesis protein ThiS [Candidatus Edwardsbacteria bacterium RifOxyA12_full_54_48]OGF09503.1 MAG: thiamine biosynthesis protein ThiS [Candidatus Edwardsbacteria bacterium GWE2_54_12]OGF14297.1 MAG: thiamine biosynthesis protein ThiS [Candidatus Edwardsbacteria bacterium GWF2_54_11]OGF17232.1 MAG: thiamine biosynthesis protein ThiS [Candidatus Edwardsbacteria bacteriu